MKQKLIRFVFQISILLFGFVPVEPVAFETIFAYTVPPQNISENVYIRVPYFSAVTTNLDYSFNVYGPTGNIVYTQGTTRQKIEANTTTEMTYRDQSGYTKVGRNYVIFTYKTTTQTNVKTHTTFFYGYQRQQLLNFNNATSAAALISEEYTFIYTSGSSGTLVGSTLDTTNLTGHMYFTHDLLFDFSELYFKIQGAYTAPLYTQAVLYFEELALFPLFTNVRGHASLRLRMTREGDYFRFQSYRDLYVDPVTRLISPYYKAGFTVTPHLYFPASRNGRVNGAKGRIEIEGFGYHGYNAVYNFTLDIGRPFIGLSGEHEVIIVRG